MSDNQNNNQQNLKEYSQHQLGKSYDAIVDALEGDVSLLGELLAPLHPSDIAELIEKLPLEHRQTLFPFIAEEVKGEVIAELDVQVQERLLQDIPKEELQQALENLDSDDAVDLVQHLEEGVAEEVRELISDREQELLDFAENTAGGMMQLEVFTAPAGWSVTETLEYMRNNSSKLPDDIYNVFIVDKRMRLEGTVSIKRLVKIPLETSLEDAMRAEPVTIQPNTPIDEVARLFEKYDLVSAAVVDEKDRLLGRITVDDVISYLSDVNENAMVRLAGLEDGEDVFAPVKHIASKRAPWLFINLLTAILASMVIAVFEGAIEKLVALAVLMPIVASMGGNAGTQTLAVTVRGLATQQITAKNAFYLLKKELLVGGFNGLFLGFLVAVGTAFVYGSFMLGLVIFLATIANHILAAIAGNIIPIILNKFGKDPAISSGVLVTTVTDVGGFFIFLGLAALFLI